MLFSRAHLGWNGNTIWVPMCKSHVWLVKRLQASHLTFFFFFFLFSFSTSEMWEWCYLLYRIVLRLEWYNLYEDTWKMRKHSISAKHFRLKLTSWSAWRRKIGLKMSPKGQEWQVESCDKQRGNIGCQLRTQIWAWIVIIYCMCNMGMLFNLS